MWVSLANTEQLAAVEGVPEVCLEYDLNPIVFCRFKRRMTSSVQGMSPFPGSEK